MVTVLAKIETESSSTEKTSTTCKVPEVVILRVLLGAFMLSIIICSEPFIEI